MLPVTLFTASFPMDLASPLASVTSLARTAWQGLILAVTDPLSLPFAIRAVASFTLVAIADTFWTHYITATTNRAAHRAGLYSLFIVLFGALTTLGYTDDRRLLIPAALGAYVGAWYAVRREQKRHAEERESEAQADLARQVTALRGAITPDLLELAAIIAQVPAADRRDVLDMFRMGMRGEIAATPAGPTSSIEGMPASQARAVASVAARPMETIELHGQASASPRHSRPSIAAAQSAFAE